ncbi:MAG: RNase adapter RapZ [Deinococcota bacterium]
MTQATVVIVTGLSGAGKSSALKALEDSGFFSVDNLPPALWQALVNEVCQVTSGEDVGEDIRVAIGVDIRAHAHLRGVDSALESLEASKVNSAQPVIVFLDAADDVLVNRYNFTRRHHPLHRASLTTDIAAERVALGDLRARADLVLDTSNLSAAELRKQLQGRFADAARFTVRLISFGFKRGVPGDSDNVFDVRVMPNPFYDPDLRPIDGRDKRVQSYAFSGDGEAFFQDLSHYITKLLAKAREQGRSHYTLAIGCTGGQHRSVAVAERLTKLLEDDVEVSLEHRDVSAALAEHNQRGEAHVS